MASETVSDTTTTLGPARSGRMADEATGSGVTSPLRRGTTLGRYVLLDLLGHGGMGAVYSAYDTQLERRVALKLLHAGPAEVLTERIFTEARALAQLRHPNVVGVHEVAEVGDFVFLAMDLVEGPTLREWADSRDDAPLLAGLLVQCARGLAAVHRAGLLHRDVKPNNVVVDTSAVRPTPIVVDFGLAAPAPSQGATLAADDGPSAPVLPWAGTPAYMAPECFEDLGGAASDQWSFALACAELLGGKRPSRADASEGRLEVSPPALRQVIARGLHNDPDSRWPDLDAMADAMESAVRPRGRGRWVGVGVIAIVGGLAAYAARGDDCVAQARAARSGVWNEALAERVRGRLEPIDPGIAERFVTEADAWSAAWESSHAQVCRRERRSSSAQWCLQDAAATVGVVAELAAGDATRDAEFFQLTGVLPRLPDPASCIGPAAEQRPQPSAEDRERFADARAANNRAGVLELLGRFSEAAALADEAWSAVGEAPALLRAPIAQRRASIALRRGTHDDAAATALDAMALAAEAKDDWMVATLALDYAEILTDLGRVDELRQHLRYADLAVTRAGSIPAQHARLEFVRGRFHEIALEPEASLAAHRRALELRREHLPRSLYEADSHVNVGALSGQLGQLDEALAEVDAGLALYRAHLGEVHPTIAHACVIRGNTLQRQGQLEAAAATLTGCIEMLEATLGPDAEKIAFASTLLGMLHAGRGDYPSAKVAFERAVEIRLARLGPEHPETGVAHTNLGNLLAAMRDDEKARAHLEQARTITVAVHGEDSPRLSSILSGLGQLAANAGDYATARDHYARGLAIAEGENGADNPSLVTNLINLAEVQGHLRDPATRATYARAETILRKAGLKSHPLQPLIDLGLGRAMIEAGEIDEALLRIDAAVQATATTEVSPGLHAGARFARARAWAADPGRRDDAITEAKAARERIPQGADPALTAEIDAWLAAAR